MSSLISLLLGLVEVVDAFSSRSLYRNGPILRIGITYDVDDDSTTTNRPHVLWKTSLKVTTATAPPCGSYQRSGRRWMSSSNVNDYSSLEQDDDNDDYFASLLQDDLSIYQPLTNSDNEDTSYNAVNNRRDFYLEADENDDYYPFGVKDSTVDFVNHDSLTINTENNNNRNNDDHDNINPFPFPVPTSTTTTATKKLQTTTTYNNGDIFASILEQPSSSIIPQSSSISFDSNNHQVIVPSIETNLFQDKLQSLQEQLHRTEQEIYQMNSGETFNINSPKQVSQVLYGSVGQSNIQLPTDKNTLESMAASKNNIMAKLILKYRMIKQQLSQRTKKQRNVDQTKNTKIQQKQQPQSKKNNPNTTQSVNESPLYLIDTSSFIFRAYYSMPPLHRSPDGMPIGAVMGFCNMLNRLVFHDMMEGKCPRMVLCWDDAPPSEEDDTQPPPSHKTFRHELYPEYKGHRPSVPIDLIPQFDLVRQAGKAYGMIQIHAPNYEADDVMATLSTLACYKEGMDVRILSGDKDLMQLITNNNVNDDHDDNVKEEEDENDNTTTTATKTPKNGNVSRGLSSSSSSSSCIGSIQMIDPMTMTVWTHESVIDKWGVPASQLGDVLALAGDTADNIPGVPGIGPKIASQLINEYGTLENVLNHTQNISQTKRREKLELYQDQALLSRKLVELVRDLNWTTQMHIMYPDDDDDDDGDVAKEDGDETDNDNDDDDDDDLGMTLMKYDDDEIELPVVSIHDLRMQPMNPNRLIRFYDAMGFHTMKQRFLERLATARPTTAVAATATAEGYNNGIQSKHHQKRRKSKYRARKKMDSPKPEDYKDVPF